MVDANKIKELRQQTGCTMNDCVSAMKVTNNDTVAAVDWLRKNTKVAGSHTETSTEHGVIGVYVHHNRRTVGAVMLCCQTDFLSNSKEFVDLANNIAMHVVATRPLFVSKSDVSTAYLEKEKEIHKATTVASFEGKKQPTDEIFNKILDGKVTKSLQEKVLLEQQLVTDTRITVQQAITMLAASSKEHIVLKNFNILSV